MFEINCPVEGFDEATYLHANQDVFEAVRIGNFFSGWEHYLFYGFRENRSGVSPEVHKKVALVHK